MSETGTKMSETDTGEASANLGWREGLTVWAVLAIFVTFLSYDAASAMVAKWWETGTFTHAFLIVPISVWVAYQRWNDVRTVPLKPSLYGLVGLVAAGMVWMLGWLADVNSIQQFALIFMYQASFVAVMGVSAARAMAFPLFYLLFMVPFGLELVPMLQQFTATFVVKAIELTGIPVFSDGIFISIPKGNFEVAETCSGVRFLIASVALGALFSNISFKSWKRRLAVITLAVAIPVIANGFRAYGIVMIAHLSDMKYAVGADHIIYGWIFFSFVIVVLILVGMTFSDRHVGDHDVPSLVPELPSAGRSTLIKFAVVAALVAATMPAYSLVISPPEPGDQTIAAAPVEIRGAASWQKSIEQRRPWVPVFVNADREGVEVYGKGTAEISVYVAHYASQGPGRELVQYSNLAAGQGWGVSDVSSGEITINGESSTYQESRIVAGPMARTVWLWYSVDGTVTSNRYAVKMLSAWSKLRGRGGEGSVFVISVDGNRTTRPARVVLEDAVRELVAETGGIDAFLDAALADEQK